MKKLIRVILITLLLQITNLSYATHAAGSEITYRELSTKKYEVKYTFYRNCDGVSLNTSSGSNTLQTSVRCTNGQQINLTSGPTLKSIESLPFRCDTGTTACGTPNTLFSGDGFEKFVFLDTLDFNLSPLSNVAFCSGDILLELSHTARGNNSISYGSFFFYARTILKDIGNIRNNSPSFLYNPKPKLCCNEPARINFAAYDPDGDSLSYNFTPALNGYSSPANTSGLFNYNNPFTTYYPSGISFPTSNPNVNPPVGINLNATTGQLVFTPTDCSQNTMAVIEVKEWRKNSLGSFDHIGSIFRDIEYEVYTCQSNVAPVLLQDTTHYYVCEARQFCFDIASSDSTLDSTGSVILSSDTLTMEWDNPVFGASFELVDSSALFKTGRFCWTPPTGSIRPEPYIFSVNIKDQNCPIVGQDVQAFYIYVVPGPNIQIDIDTLPCGQYSLQALFDSSALGTDYSWEVLDTNYNSISGGYEFTSTQDSFSASRTDTLHLEKSGVYIIRFSAIGDSTKCESSSTEVIGSKLLGVSLSADDSIFCVAKPINITSLVDNPVGNISYSWSRNGIVNPSDTSANYLTEFALIDKDSLFKITATDSLGCTAQDSMRIYSYNSIKQGFDTSYAACQGDTISLTLDSEFIRPIWSIGKRTSSVDIINTTYLTVSYTDSFNCRLVENSNITFNPKPTIILDNDTSCGDSLLLNPGNTSSYLWSTGAVSQSIVVYESDSFWIEATSAFGCKKRDSASIIIYNGMNVDLGSDTAQCGGQIVLNSNLSEGNVWSTGDTTAEITVGSSNIYSIISLDSNACESTDTINVTIHPVPLQSWQDSVSYCSDSVISVSSDTFFSYLWSTGSTSIETEILGDGLYTLLFTDSNNCSNIDSIFIEINSLPAISLGNDTAFCGDSLLLNLSTNNQITWSTGDTISFTTINASGDYWVTVTDSNGCSAGDTVNIVLLSNSTTPIITRNGDSISSNLVGIHYWFLDGNPTVGDNGNTIAIDNRFGDFTTIHEDTNGCISDTSNTVSRTLGLKDTRINNLKVYPNPTTGKVTIDAAGLGQIQSISLYDANGKVVDHSTIQNGQRIIVSWKGANGLYLLEARTESGIYRSSVMCVK